MRTFYRVLAVVGFFFLSGCATSSTISPRPQLPDVLGDKGIVFAEVQGLGHLRFFYADVIIDGRVAGKMSGNHIGFALAPGEYTLDALRWSLPSGGGYYGGVNVTMKEVKSWPINRKFAIEPGVVTNLGQLLLIPDPKDAEKKRYFIHAVDNNNDASYFFGAFYLDLYGKLGPNAIRLSPGPYVRNADLQNLRRHIALSASGLATDPYIIGPAGTLAKVKRDPSGKAVGVDLIPSPTMSGIHYQASQPRKDRAVFLTSDARMFSVRGGQVRQIPKPAAEEGRELFLAGDRDILQVDKGFRLHISNDDGQTWQSYSAPPVDRVRGVGLVEDNDGYYIFHSNPQRLLFGKYGSALLQEIPLPPNAVDIHRLTICQNEIFLERKITPFTHKTPFPFFVRGRAGGDWQTRFMPLATCTPIEFIDNSGQKLRTQCNQEKFETADGGLTWTRL